VGDLAPRRAPANCERQVTPIAPWLGGRLLDVEGPVAVLLAFVVLLVAAAPASGTGPPTDPDAPYVYDPKTGATYACAPPIPDMPKPPPLPPLAAAQRRALDIPLPTCAKGEVAWPKSDSSPKALPPSSVEHVDEAAGARAGTPSCELAVDTYRHCWANESKSYPPWEGTFAAWGVQSQHQPTTTDLFSLSQIWAILPTPGGISTMEFGWAVDRGRHPDYSPRLFAYHFDNGALTCFDGCNGQFIPYGGPALGSIVQANPIGVGYTYGIQLNGAGWWVNYSGYWLGYYPPTAWPNWFPSYVTRVDAGGEVASTGGQPASQMGNGYFGTNLTQSAMWHSFWRTRQPYNAPVTEYVNPTTGTGTYGSSPAGTQCAYRAEVSAPAYGQIHYGGPGFAYC
jgi:hypothetical protein